ncbi:hypothetical protein GOP47_0013135 [Adiantum capillus-veneris]|uniref:Uncharacterized protein n=1 Tax=Adiantum capillus-veneris TaxID=13818 RepID=A0A9D4ZD56_ADICA|nr:hypothetical protein GOP47_0013135 [Adiantum capillus-veneris]
MSVHLVLFGVCAGRRLALANSESFYIVLELAGNALHARTYEHVGKAVANSLIYMEGAVQTSQPCQPESQHESGFAGHKFVIVSAIPSILYANPANLACILWLSPISYIPNNPRQTGQRERNQARCNMRSCSSTKTIYLMLPLGHTEHSILIKVKQTHELERFHARVGGKSNTLEEKWCEIVAVMADRGVLIDWKAAYDKWCAQGDFRPGEKYTFCQEQLLADFCIHAHSENGWCWWKRLGE